MSAYDDFRTSRVERHDLRELFPGVFKEPTFGWTYNMLGPGSPADLKFPGYPGWIMLNERNRYVTSASPDIYDYIEQAEAVLFTYLLSSGIAYRS